MRRNERLKLIESIVTGTRISSQQQLLAKLGERGIRITQATLSRDLRQIGIARLSEGSEAPRYRVVKGGRIAAHESADPYRTAVISVSPVRQLIVIRTMPGFAAGVASIIDRSENRFIAATVAGDDTILAVAHEDVELPAAARFISEMFPRSSDR